MKTGVKRWPLGFGVLYLFINFPLVVFVKIGITGRSASGRARQVDKAAPGIPFPIMIMILPAVYQIEQSLHNLFSPLNARFYKGDGSTEWFWFPAGVVVLGIGLAYWWAVDFTVLYFAGFSIIEFLIGLI